MVQYCRKCGKELSDDAEFCDGCGFQLDENLNNNSQVVKKDSENKNEFVKKLPLILAIIGIIVSIAEGLGTPMLMGWNNILTAMGIGIVGGLIGILLMEKLDEPLIAAVEFIATGALIYIFIGRFGEISTVLFIIAAILTLYFKGYYTHRKKLWVIPILTVVLIFGVIIAGSAFYHMNAGNSIEVSNITQDIKSNGYGYYNGKVYGDLFVGTNFDYLKVTVDFYDDQGKILYSTIGWNQMHPDSGKTYKFEGMYYKEKQPIKAEIKVFDSATSSTPLHSENITLTTDSGV